MSAILSASAFNIIQHNFPSLIPVIAYPFSLGMWFTTSLTDANARTLWSLSNTGATNQYWLVRKTTGNAMQITARSGASEASSATSGTISTDVWNYVVARFISSTARYLHLFTPTAKESISNTTTRLPTGVNFMAISDLATSGGSFTEFWDGKVAEYWMILADCFPGLTTGAEVLPLVRKLAYEGPFAYPLVASKLVDYRSFRKGPGAWGMEDQAEQGDYYRNVGLFQSSGAGWQCANTPYPGPGEHPPLPAWYKRTNDRSRMMVV